MGQKMNILFAVSEATPFAKTGGLADVAGALPTALAMRGHQGSPLSAPLSGDQRKGI